jgi:hypothetical protein
MILILSRGSFCPKDHQQHLELAANYPKINVAYTQIVTISTTTSWRPMGEAWDAGDHTMHHPVPANRSCDHNTTVRSE